MVSSCRPVTASYYIPNTSAICLRSVSYTGWTLFTWSACIHSAWVRLVAAACHYQCTRAGNVFFEAWLLMWLAAYFSAIFSTLCTLTPYKPTNTCDLCVHLYNLYLVTSYMYYGVTIGSFLDSCTWIKSNSLPILSNYSHGVKVG